MNNRQTAQYHYHDDDGLIKRKWRMDDTIAQYVKAGIIPSGWHIAYGTFADYSVKRIQKFASQRRVRSIPLQTSIEMLQDDIDRGYIKLGEFILSDETWSRS